MSQLDLEKALELAKERLKKSEKKIDKRSLKNPENRFFYYLESNYTLIESTENMKMSEVLDLLKVILKESEVKSIDVHTMTILKRLDKWAKSQNKRLVYRTPRFSGFQKCRMVKK